MPGREAGNRNPLGADKHNRDYGTGCDCWSSAGLAAFGLARSGPSFLEVRGRCEGDMSRGRRRDSANFVFAMARVRNISVPVHFHSASASRIGSRRCDHVAGL